MENKNKTSFLKNWLSILGPGIITAALVFGPSKMTITSKMGTDYGFALLWIIVVAVFFMMVFTNMGARIGLAREESLLSLINQKFGKSVSIIIGLGIFLVATSFQSGNATGVSISISEATGTNPKIWIIVFNVIGILLLFFKSFYVILEKLMLGLIILMLFAFLSTAVMIQTPLVDFSKGFIPTIPEGSLGLIIAFTASCFSIVGAFYQSYLVQARRKASGAPLDASRQLLGSRVGITILGIMSAAVMVCAANTLHPLGIKLSSAAEMGKALEPLLGSYASHLFFIGLFGASFSSLIGNAVLGGSLLGDTFGYGNNLNNRMVKLFISLVMIFGSIIALVFGKLPLELIVFAQSITIFLVPFIGIIMLLIANDKEIMGDFKNKTLTNIWAVLGLMVLVVLAYHSAQSLIK
ncbi:Nramp family divalent metal transporter [Sphingobacterium psychroaquaticum]|uniref:Mn2+ and Fe2+ transporters of the NRAMP family n=1 Tax=Sphingobacterium psychroaquaticum TaxID=561061 RepID=A0A1X7JSF8_9SPHI|nr:Nramp family divalent metal transporter [Sphingobacterium psychroaquaticum]QBQ40974.1 divalent metal cation transporter [Sphingobacterium psychroaquaticum]SMG30504.1 Mn2+ and Fe2+ transporters of the NRAMP family [Sphingobacterium psychroaquaticum]